jgi:hypothetical protein
LGVQPSGFSADDVPDVPAARRSSKLRLEADAGAGVALVDVSDVPSPYPNFPAVGSAPPRAQSLRFDITPSYSYDVDMHRTTINLDEGIFRRVKKLSKSKGKSIARTIEDLLRAALDRGSGAEEPELPLHRQNGPRAGVDIADRNQIYDLMEGR